MHSPSDRPRRDLRSILTDLQREASIEDQVRRCGKFIEQAGGDPGKAQIFSDCACPAQHGPARLRGDDGSCRRREE